MTNQAGKPSSHYYKATDSKTIEIKGIGKLTDVVISGSSLSGKFTSTGSTTTQSISGNKSSISIGTASNTDLFCRTWKLESFSGLDENTDMDTVGLITITISNSGTYFVNGSLDYDLETGEATIDPEGFTSYWKWTNSSGNKFCYSDTAVFDCNADNSVNITTLNATTLVTSEDLGGEAMVSNFSAYTLPARVAINGNSIRRKLNGKHLPKFLLKK